MPDVQLQNVRTSIAARVPATVVDQDQRAAYLDQMIDLIKWALAREDDAAATICRLSYRIEPDTELAKMARTYAADVRQFAARLRDLLPDCQNVDSEKAEIAMISHAVIQSLPHDKAVEFLIRFLLQHAETTSEVLQSAGTKLHSKAAEMLWRKAARERRKLAGWVRELELQRLASLAAASSSSDIATTTQSRRADPASEVAVPRQLVIWM